MTSETLKLRPTTYCPSGGRRSSARMPRPAVQERTIASRLARLAARTRWFAQRAADETREMVETQLPRSA